MTICDLTNAYTPTSGGIRTYLSEKRSFLQRTNHRHAMIVPGDRDETIRDGHTVTHVVRGPVIPGCAPYRAILRLDKVLRLLLAERPQIVELGTGYLLPLAAFAYRRLTGASVVGFCHTDYPHAYVRPFLEHHAPRLAGVGTRLATWHLRAVYSRCDAVIAASEAMIETLRAAGVERIEKVPLGVDTKLFHPSKRDPALRRRLGVEDDELLIAYVGRIDEEKRTPVLLDAFVLAMPRLKGKLLVVGDGPLRPRVEELASVTDRIMLLPYQRDRHELARLLASSDVYLTAGPHETFALSVVEAQASGLPVIGVRAGAMPERVPESVGMLCEVDSPGALAESILALSSNGLRAKGREARMLVEGTLTWESSLSRLLEIYERLRCRQL